MGPNYFISRMASPLSGDITVPGDKSISHRAIILGSIAKGITTINGFLAGEDCLATLNAFRAMGVCIDGPDLGRVVIQGVGKFGLKKPPEALQCGNSGTSMRLLAGLLAAQSFDSKLIGDESLTKRPMERISLPLKEMGALVETAAGRPPLHIHGGQMLHGIRYKMPVASAQVKSCLLLAGLYATGDTEVIEPGLTRDHTEQMLKAFSYPIQQSAQSVVINANGECQGTDIMVPGDISSAAFFIVAATIIPQSTLYIRNVGVNPTRTGIIQILNRMGANIEVINIRTWGGELVADLLVKHAPLKGIDIPKEMVPLAIDEFPVLFIAASCAEGQTTLRGAKELRSKESDRIAAMVLGLNQLGISADALDDGIIIQGGQLQGGVVDSMHDHRIAMAFAIAGSVARAPVTIQNCRNVATSFPTFVRKANQVNLAIQDIYNEA